MAIKITRDSEDKKLTLELKDGDKGAFDKIMREWDFTDEISLVRFAMATMLESTDKTLSVTKTDGSIKQVAPGYGYLKTTPIIPR